MVSRIPGRRSAVRGLIAALAVLLAFCLAAPGAARAAYGDAPVIHSAEAVAISTNAATLQATVTPNENFFEARFSYCRVGVCPEGTIELPVLSPTPEGPGDDPGLNPQHLSIPVSDLLPSTEYEVTLVVTTDTWDGIYNPATVKTFTFKTADPVIPVQPVAPKPTTGQASGITPTAATLNGTLVPGTTGAPSTKTAAFFQWGPADGGFPFTTPVKQFPTDASEYAISAGLTGLQPNRTYQFRLVLTRGGAQFIGAPVQFTTKPEPNCPAGTEFETITHGRVTAVGCFMSAGGLAVAASEVRLNGVLLKPQGGKLVSPPSLSCGGGSACTQLLNYLATGNKFYIAKGAARLGTTGNWRMSVETIPNLHTGVLTKSNIDWDGEGPLLSLGANAGVELLDFPLAGQFTFTPHEDGSSRLGLLLGLPEIFGGVTGDTAVKINPGGDISFDRIQIEVGEVAIKKVTLGNLRFLYDRTEDVWEGTAAITLPTPSAIQVGVGIRVKDGKFNEFAGSLDNINYHITYGIYLQRIDVLFGLNPLRVGGGIGLTAGPKYGGVSLIGVNGSFQLNMESRQVQVGKAWMTYPPSLQLGGEVTIFTIPVREASVEVFFTQFAWVEAEFKIGHTFIWNDIAVFGLEGRLGGSLKNTFVDFWGTGGLTVLGYEVASASAILNNDGIAACGKTLGGAVAVGGYFVWKTGKPSSVWYCDMDKLREALAGASVSNDDGRIPLNLPRNASQAVVRFIGTDGAPRVRLFGPGGRVIETPGPGVGHATDDNTWLALRDELHNTTDVLLLKTGAGGWSYELMEGSAAVATVQMAGPLPPARVRASVAREFVTRTAAAGRPRGAGRRAKPRTRATGRYVLRWNLRRIPGQQVSFIEEGRGVPPRVLTRTRKARGSFAFRPHLLPQRGRRIVAVVEQFGRPRARIPVARYTAPPVPKVVRVKGLRAVRRGGRLVVSWQRLPGAGAYRTYTIEANGRRTFRQVNRPRLALRGPRAKSVRAVIVQPVSVTLDLGRRNRVNVASKPRKPAGAKKGKPRRPATAKPRR